MSLESKIKKGSIVSWVSCGATWKGKVKFVHHQFAFVQSLEHKDLIQTFDIVNGDKLTLVKT